MSRADKKQRKEAKRKARKMQIRRLESISPSKRLGDSRGEMECWTSDSLASRGQEQIFVYKRAGGLSGLACFLVDRGVVGLKDAYTLMPTEREAVNRVLDNAEASGIVMRLVSVEHVRKIVAGGIRWAHEHGMRLPKDWHKTATVIGGVGDWETADVSMFAKEFAGHPEDLRRRLIGQSMESFLQRTDIAFIFNDAAPYMDMETGRYENNGAMEDGDFDDHEDDDLDDFPEEKLHELDQRIAPLAAEVAAGIVSWLAARKQPASSQLDDAIKHVFLSSLLSAIAMPNANKQEKLAMAGELLQKLTNQMDASHAAEYELACNQIEDYMKTESRMMENALNTVVANMAREGG